MKIASKSKDYEVFIEKNPLFLQNLISDHNVFFVIDDKVHRLYRDLLDDIPAERLFLFNAIEENKTIHAALEICDRVSLMPAKRNVVIAAVGGGITQDITGFVANILYRGVRWVFVPTTLLSACDSCIGGKTSLNYKTYKNLLGTFYPPDKIHIWSGFFDSLSDRDFKSGLGEIEKFYIMSGNNGLTNLEAEIDLLLCRHKDTVDRFIKSCLQYKKGYIEKDEFDRGDRIKLNFAHTFGHAIEVLSHYDIPHGTAVAIGIIIANHISFRRGYLKEDIQKRCEKQLLKIIDIDPEEVNHPAEEYISIIKKDKKQTSTELKAILITEFGECNELTLINDLTAEEISDAVCHFKNIYC